MTLEAVSLSYRDVLAPLYDADEALAVFHVAAGHFLALTKPRFYAEKARELSSAEQELLIGALEQLKTGKPVQYVTGETAFFNLPFKTSPGALIPRPETEELVQWILDHYRGLAGSSGPVILDIGTGTGCIAVALKKNLPSASAFGLDISESALLLAKENAKLNEADINFVRGDILDGHASLPGNIEFDLVVSNPPYITGSEKNEMSLNVLDYEPHLALFVPDEDPLLFYRAVADFAKRRLSKGGLLFFEINQAYGQQVVSLLTLAGFGDVSLRKDLNGRDRMIKCIK